MAVNLVSISYDTTASSEHVNYGAAGRAQGKLYIHNLSFLLLFIYHNSKFEVLKNSSRRLEELSGWGNR